MATAVTQVIDYHEASKHHYHRYARGPGYLDWANQPDPFRRYRGAPLIRLRKFLPTEHPHFDPVFSVGAIPPEPLSDQTLSQLFFDSLALSAWKRAGASTWALRVNPSSGNLHPTEGYLLCGAVERICERPMVAHYAPREHLLELRAEIPPTCWQRLVTGLPEGAVLVGLTTIFWREAWKYGERAYRYCVLDMGHALAAVGIAAAGLGWQAKLVDDLNAEELAQLLGVADPADAEAEHPECLLAVMPQSQSATVPTVDAGAITDFNSLKWLGKPNQLSPSHVRWTGIEAVARSSRKPRSPAHHTLFSAVPARAAFPDRELPLRRIIHQRRSALAMDAVTWMSRSAFYHMLRKTLPGADRIPFHSLPWPPQVHLALFVHRVEELVPGLYFLVREESRTPALRAAMRTVFQWQKPAGCPEELALYLLAEGDMRQLATRVSCIQDIAGDGCFSLAMIAVLREPLDRYGPWFYPRLYWECGMIGQVLYLEAEAAGLRSTGIGCYFDDPTHEVLGLKGLDYQDLYHFTVGGYLEDRRLTTLPAYPPEDG